MKNIIEIKNYKKNYKNFTAIDNMNLSIKKGIITGFVGLNGAGKSTTIRSIMNVISPTSGTITVNNLDSVKDARKIKEIISYMPSDSLFPENTTPRRIFELSIRLGKGGLGEKNRLARLFDLDIDKKIKELSSGNKKKVSIINALLGDREIYILDEPTNALDPIMQEHFFEEILKLKEKGKTILLSSHNLNEINEYCDEVVLIKKGKIVKVINEIKRNLKVVYTLKNNEKKEFIHQGKIKDLINNLSKEDITDLEITKSIDEYKELIS